MESEIKLPANTPKRRPPSKTSEGRENQLISMAYDLVEERLRNGTATSQETTHFLKEGSTRSRMERAILKEQQELLKAKTESLKSNKVIEEMYKEAMTAFSTYNGSRKVEADE